MKAPNSGLLRSAMGAFGMAMMVAGVGAILLAGALYAYGQYEQAYFASELHAEELASGDGPPIMPTPMPPTAIPPTAVVPGAPKEAGAAVEILRPTSKPSPMPTPSPIPSPTPLPSLSRITIPSIHLDSIIRESKIVNGQWQVPKFIVGHLQGTATLGENGNIVLSGHIESISSGNVFARLGDLQPGDAIALYAGSIEVDYKVTEKKVVTSHDLSVVAPTSEPILTMITCTGTFNVLAGEYDHRLVVIAKPVPTPMMRNVL